MKILLEKFIHSFYEKCLGPYQDCKGSKNLSNFQDNDLVRKFYGRFWQETRYSWIRDKDFIAYSTASGMNPIIPPSALRMTWRGPEGYRLNSVLGP